MANPLQIVKNASKLVSQAIVKRDKEFERTTKTILKAVVSELNTTLKGKPLSELLTLEASEAIEFDTYGLLDIVGDGATDRGSYITGEKNTLPIKRISWDGQWIPLAGNDPTDRPYQFDLRVDFGGGIVADMECIIHLA